jgi:hypothetical protein
VSVGYRHGCKPGYRVIVDSAGHAERCAQLDAAYAEVEAATCDSWKRPWPGLGARRDGNGVGSNGVGSNGVGSHGFRGQVEGDACTINGEPGTLQRRNGQLQCVADDSDDEIDEIFDAAQGGVDPVEAAHRAYLHDLTHAWKRG